MERIFLYIVKFFYKIFFKNYLREISLLLNKKFKKNIISTKIGVEVLITARGKIVNISHLEEFIKKNYFSTFALDVMSIEPCLGSLSKFKNCIIIPHNALMSFISRKNMELSSVKTL